MYHYFAATEIYNAIRVFIAAYVWMTGFGNFSYYYVRKDFSLPRFAQVIESLTLNTIFALLCVHCLSFSCYSFCINNIPNSLKFLADDVAA